MAVIAFPTRKDRGPTLIEQIEEQYRDDPSLSLAELGRRLGRPPAVIVRELYAHAQAHDERHAG